METVKAQRYHRLFLALLLCCATGAYAKLPPPSDEAKAKAVAAKAKSAEAAKKQAEALAKAQDRAAGNYRQKHGGNGMTAPAARAEPMAMKHSRKKK